jgi:hypothetical protein
VIRAKPVEEADDGVDEFVGIYRQFGEPASMLFVATDSALTVATLDEAPAVTVSATASVAGDRSVLEQNLEPVQ